MHANSEQRVAVIGSGAAGLAAAWLLSGASPSGRPAVKVTLFEKDDRLGGHAHTVYVDPSRAGTEVGGAGKSTPPVGRPKISDMNEGLAIDTGFIVFNEQNYPNFTAWMEALDVETIDSEMSFAVSRDDGNYEYKGGEFSGLFVQPSNLVRPRFWRMLKDLTRFYREAKEGPVPDANCTLRAYLEQGSYSDDFIQDHLLPFGAAIWSSSPMDILDYPAEAFISFCDNHGLLNLVDRPQWKTVRHGSASYVEKVRESLRQQEVMTSVRAASVSRTSGGVVITDGQGNKHFFDQVVFATHADQALALLETKSHEERQLLGAFSYTRNLAILHTDINFLPKRKKAWASWNYLDSGGADMSDIPTVSYWMNRLQSIQSETNYIVTLNPLVAPQSDKILRTSLYEHPVFTVETRNAQRELWSLQGKQRTWYCGAYFGAGFHEDAIQSGLAVAEALAGVKRPWSVSNPSGRIFVHQNSADGAQRDTEQSKAG